MTLADTAARAACTKSYLSALENAKRGAPKDAILARLDSALQLAPGTLREHANRQRALELGGEGLARDMLQLARYRALAKELLKQAHPREKERLHARVLNELVELESASTCSHPTRPPVQRVTWPVFHVQAPRDVTTLQLRSDHMSPELRVHDLLMFAPARQPCNGADALVVLTPRSQCVFARVFLERTKGRDVVRLQPVNTSYAPVVVARSRVMCFKPLATFIRSIEPAIAKE